MLARTRIPAFQVGERGVWSFPCDLPAVATLLVARAYDVAGNRQAGSSRAVLRVAASAAPAGPLARRPGRWPAPAARPPAFGYNRVTAAPSPSSLGIDSDVEDQAHGAFGVRERTPCSSST